MRVYRGETSIIRKRETSNITMLEDRLAMSDCSLGSDNSVLSGKRGFGSCAGSVGQQKKSGWLALLSDRSR